MAHRINSPDAQPALVNTATQGAQGHWADLNTATGFQGTHGNALFFEMLQEEDMNLLAAAGIVPVVGTFNQRVTAIQTLIANALGSVGGPTQETTIATATTAVSLNDYVATAALTLSVPQSSSLNRQFVCSVLAEGGAVTITPYATDVVEVDGVALAAGASAIVPVGDGAKIRTDAAGHVFVTITKDQLGSGTIASAATTDVGSIPGDIVQITGATEITSFGASLLPGQTKMVRYAGALTVADNGNIAVVGGANIVTAAGDFGFVFCTAAGVVTYLHIPIAGLLAGVGNVTLSGSADIVFPAGASPVGTVGSSGAIHFPGGFIKNWAYILLEDYGNTTTTNWVFPTPFPTAPLTFKATNCSLAAGQEGNAAQFGIVSMGGLITGTEVALTLRNTGAVGTQCIFYVEAEGY